MGGRSRRGWRSHERRDNPGACKICHEGRWCLQERLREALNSTEKRNDGSRIVCGESEAAGGHCSRGGRICPPEKNRQGFQRAVSVSPGKDAFVHSFSDQADFLLLRVRQGRRRVQLRDGHGEVRISRGREGGRGEMRHCHSTAEGAFAGGAERKPATFGSRGDTPRGAIVFRETARRGARRQSGARVSRGSWPKQGCHRAFRNWLRTERRRRSAAAVETKVQR